MCMEAIPEHILHPNRSRETTATTSHLYGKELPECTCEDFTQIEARTVILWQFYGEKTANPANQLRILLG